MEIYNSSESGTYNLDLPGSGGSIELSMEDYEDSFEDLNNLSQGHLDAMAPFDGMFQYNQPYHIRTGIIQDPNYDAFYDRYNTDGTLKTGAKTVLDQTKSQYPFNGMNSVDNYGFRVSVVWLDGYDGGLFNGQNPNKITDQKTILTSQVGAPVQKLWLTFPNAWADHDRSCGDFHMPLPGTVCRIGMARGNVGVYLGALPMDRAKLPILPLGSFLRRHFNQSLQTITDVTMQQAMSDLDKDIFTTDLVMNPRPGTDAAPKPYQTDTGVLSSLRSYAAHRDIIANNGMLRSVKVTSNVHGTVDNKRLCDWITGETLVDGITEWRAAVGGDTNIVSGTITAKDGSIRFSRTSNGFYSVDLVTDLTLTQSFALLKDHFTPQSARLVTSDAQLSFSCLPVTTIGTALTQASLSVVSSQLTLAQFAAIALNTFTIPVVSANLTLADSVGLWTHASGTMRSTTLPALTQVASLETFMGPSLYYDVSGPDIHAIGNPAGGQNCPPKPPDTPVITCG